MASAKETPIQVSAEETSIQVTALDAVVNVNTFFTVAVFLGLSLTSPSDNSSLVSDCTAKITTRKYLLLFEVLSFSCFLLSTLVAHGMKLWMVLKNSKDVQNAIDIGIKKRSLRFWMLTSAIGSIVGTIFLVLSMVCIIEIRFGPLHCDDSWAEKTIIPMVILVGIGAIVFITSVIYDFGAD